MSAAIAISGAADADSAALLRKQLLAAEYSYANGAYFDAKEKTLTYLFIYYGEYVVKNAGRTVQSEIIISKDRFDAYNNSHGGAAGGPGM